MEIVIIETPFAADTEEGLQRNREYALEAMRDSLYRGEAPFASHLLYTQCLEDTVPTEREMGIQAGFAIGRLASKTIVYADLGVSPGMQRGIADAEDYGRSVEYRRIR